MKKDPPITIDENVDNESILTIPLFSYLIVLDSQWNNVFSYSFDFESPDQCESFGFYFHKQNTVKVFELQFVIDLIHKHLLLIDHKQKPENGLFIDLYLAPNYICLLQDHGLFFIAIYSENVKKFSRNQKEFIQASLRGLGTAFFSVFYPSGPEHSQITSQTPLSNESINSFLNTIPVILFQPSVEGKSRNCAVCPPDKYCIPKMLMKKISDF